LDSNIINKLIQLFDLKSTNSGNKVKTYIEDERLAQGLDYDNVTIKSCAYGYGQGPSLLIDVFKNNKEFLHITLHLCPQSFELKGSGPIHFRKNAYRVTHPIISKKGQYVSIFVQQPFGKPDSLHFSVEDTCSSGKHPNDSELQKEINVVLTVLNRLFNEDNKEFYIGNNDVLIPVHEKLNNVLKNINTFKNNVTRKDFGTRVLPLSNNKYIFNRKNAPKTPKRKYPRTTTRKRTFPKEPLKK
jgi:hypothetical protein